MNIGWERKIGYSFLGLMAGNAVSLMALLLIAVVQRLDAFSGIKGVWSINVGQAFGWSLVVWVYSMPAWAIVGLPVVVLLRPGLVADFYWITAALVGAMLGAFAMLLTFFVLNGGRADLANLSDPSAGVPFYLAALIAGVVFAVYCSLVKAALHRQAKENGAPNSAPRSVAWFDF
ncbi:MAG: hypothetical protein JO300_00905 [Silvibacterium sp.]|nr:hypothetical protein [Silvibacterium sp.]MBV8438817.1 hypothetical protein [Silvibacterium sp.]